MQVAIRFLKLNERPTLIRLHDERQRVAPRPEPAWLAAFYKRMVS